MIGTNTTRNQTPHRLCLPFIAARLHGGVGSASVSLEHPMGEYTRDAFDPEPFDLDAQHDRYPSDGFIPLSSGGAKDSPADTTGGGAWTPPSFDAAGWIADRHPDLVPRLRAIDPACADEFVDIVFRAYQQGRMDNIGVVRSRFENLAAMVRKWERGNV